MFQDEFRTPDLLRKQKIKELLSDPENAYDQIQKLKGVEKERAGRQIVAERDDLKRRLHENFIALTKERGMVARLERKNRELEKKVEDLRQSKTMRVGKAVTGPVRFVRTVVTDPVKVAKSVRRQLIKPSNILRRWPNAASRNHGRVSRFAPPIHSPVVTKENSTALNSNTAPAFEKQLNAAWFASGSIDEAYELLATHDLEAMSLTSKTEVLVNRVYGAHAVKSNPPSLPPRSEAPAYIAEPSRVMYAVHSSPAYNSNGYSTRTRGVARGLSDAGKDVVVVSRSGYPWDSTVDGEKPSKSRTEKVIDGISYIHIPGGNLNRDRLDTYIQVASDAFVREALMLRPAVIQSASNFRTALPALIASRRVGVPFVYEVRGLWEITEASAKPGFENTQRYALMEELETYVAQQADHVLAITQQVADEMIRRGVDPVKISLAPNAVNVDQFLPIPKDESYAKNKGLKSVPTVGFAGSLVEYEGLDLLLDASKILESQGIEHQVVIAGSGAAQKTLQEKVLKDGINSVHFLGRISHTEIPRLLSVIDLVVIPRTSTKVTELVSPLKPLESFAAGRATVLSDVAPHLNLAGQDQKRAKLFKAGDANSLAQVLKSLIADKDARSELARYARLWVVRERNWKAIGESIVDSQREAKRAYAELARDYKPMKKIQVGLIGDDFTRATVCGAFDTVLLSRSNWREQIEAHKFDLIFVESAWEGNSGDWHRGVGYYSEGESRNLIGLLELARRKAIPTVFWNKEDPVHFARFAPNAARFDHVFTTDANMISRYAATPGHRNKTIAAMPFYAEPSLHNPLPTDRPFKKTYAYAGTYYGKRYPERSHGLDNLLESAAELGLDIYDRQADNPDSPYKFPDRFGRFIRGALSYQDVVKSYNSHIGHLNVNSVTDSPTMFSRRVIEIPACGGIVLSAAGRGVSESLGSNIPATNSAEDQRAMILDWAQNPSSRLDEIWRQMRTIYRSHTTDTALSIVCRTAGIATGGVSFPSIAIEVRHLCESVAEELLQQSKLPDFVEYDQATPQAIAKLEMAGIKVGEITYSDIDLQVMWDKGKSRTWVEDVLFPFRFGNWGDVKVMPTHSYDGVSPIVAPCATGEGVTAIRNRAGESLESIALYLPDRGSPGQSEEDNTVSEPPSETVGTVLVAGHDLKFAKGILAALDEEGVEVIVDKWESHTIHDEDASLSALKRADVVFCEWGLGNAVWYSKNIEAHQKLIIRVHSQELFRPYLRQISHENVDRYIFVGELIRATAIRSHGVPAAKSIVIPNPVDVRALALEKEEEARWGIGYVGMVPQTKRPDLAIDLIEKLVTVDSKFHLRIKGKTPEDYPWMLNRLDEMEFYNRQQRRIEELNLEFPGAVRLDGFGTDMAEWYRNVGNVLSVSDFESFHLTLADGAASGARPLSLAWPGSDRIYPEAWLFGSIEDIAEALINSGDPRDHSESWREYATEKFNMKDIHKTILEILL